MYEAHEETRRVYGWELSAWRRTKTQQTNPTPREKTTSFCASRILSRASWRNCLARNNLRSGYASAMGESSLGGGAQHVGRLLPTRRNRPHSCRAADQRDELAPSHS